MDSTILIFLLLIIIVIITLIILNFGKKSGGSLEKFKNIKLAITSDHEFIIKLRKLFDNFNKKFTADYTINHNIVLTEIQSSISVFSQQIKDQPDDPIDDPIRWPDPACITKIDKYRNILLNDITKFDTLSDILGEGKSINNLLFTSSSQYKKDGAGSFIAINYKHDFDDKFEILINQIKDFIIQMKTKYNTEKNRSIKSYILINPDFTDINLYLPSNPFIFGDFTLEFDEKTADCELSELIRHDNLVEINEFIVLSPATKIDIQDATKNAIADLITKLKSIRLTTTLSAAEEKALNNPIPNSTADRLTLYNLLKSFYPRLQDVFQNHDIRIPSLESIEKFNQRYSVEKEIPGKIGIYYQKDENLPKSHSYPNGTIILYPEHETDLEVGPLIIKSFIENDLKSQCPPDIITKVIQNKIILTPKYIMRNVKDNKLIEFTKTNI